MRQGFNSYASYASHQFEAFTIPFHMAVCVSLYEKQSNTLLKSNLVWRLPQFAFYKLSEFTVPKRKNIRSSGHSANSSPINESIPHEMMSNDRESKEINMCGPQKFVALTHCGIDIWPLRRQALRSSILCIRRFWGHRKNPTSNSQTSFRVYLQWEKS